MLTTTLTLTQLLVGNKELKKERKFSVLPEPMKYGTGPE
jgi:hypothetical protein